MAVYRMTPEERRARARALMQSRKERAKYRDIYAYADVPAERYTEAAPQLSAANKAEPGFITRGLSTVGDIAANVFTGTVKGLEGIADLGMGVIGGVGGIFSEDFADSVKDAIAYDWTYETVSQPLQEALRYSYLDDSKIGQFIENVASGVGQMLPAVAVSIVTGGAGAPSAVSQALSLGTMGASAAGTSTEEAYNDGANYYAGLGYGIASGAVEIGTEKLFGGVTKAVTGAGIFDGVKRSLADTVADTGVKRVIKTAVSDAIGEGMEEIGAELARPALKTIYKGKEALGEYMSPEYWKGVGEAGLAGSATALAYSGSVGYGLAKKGYGYTGKEADIAESLEQIESLRRKAENLQAENELEANEAALSAGLRGNYRNIEKALSSMDGETRAKAIKKFSLEKAFSEDGHISEHMEGVLSGAPEASASVSFSLRSQLDTVEHDLERLSSESGTAVSVFSGELTDEATRRKSKFIKTLNTLGKLSGTDTSFVITSPSESFKAALVDDRTIYIGADSFENDTWAGDLIHEYTHFSEGTEEYAKMQEYLLSDDIKVGGEMLWKLAQNEVLAKDYGYTEEQISDIKSKMESGAELTEGEKRVYDAFSAEITAHETEILLGNEAFIDRICAEDAAFASKLVSRIAAMRRAIGKSSAEKAEYKKLETARKLYVDAAKKAGNAKLVRFILSAFDGERKEDIDGSTETEYNKKRDGLWERLSPNERSQLYSRISEMYYLDYTEKRLPNGNYLLDIENKLIETDGDFDDPSIESIVEFAEFSNEIPKARTYFNEFINNGGSIRESIGYCNHLCKEKVAICYTNDNSESDSRFGGEGRNSGDTGGVYKGSKNRRRVSRSDKRAISYHFADDGSVEIKYNDGTSEIKYSRKRKYKNISAKEYAIIKSSIMAKNADYIASGDGLPLIDIIRSADYFYVYENLGHDKFGVLKQIELSAKNQSRTLAEEERINRVYGISINRTRGEVDTSSSFVKDSSRNSISGIGITGKRAGNSDNARLYQQESERDGERNSGDGAGVERGNGVKYSLKKESEVGKLQKKAQETRERVYLSKDARAIIDEIVEENLSFDGYNVKLKGRGNILNTLLTELNSAEKGKEDDITLKIADVFIESAVTENVYDGADADEYRRTLEVLRPYMHRLDLESLDGEIKNRFGKDRSPFLVWQVKKGEAGIAPDVAAAEIKDAGISISAENSADIFFEIYDKYHTAKETLKKETQSIKALMDETELNRLRQDIARKVLVSMDTKGSVSHLAKYEAERGKSNELQKQIFDMEFILAKKSESLTGLRERFRELKSAYWEELKRNRPKVYTKKDAKTTFNDIMAEMKFGDKYGSIIGKSRQEVLETLYYALNHTSYSDRPAVALDFAEYLIGNTLVKTLYEDPPKEYAQAIDTIKALRKYFHSIDLSEIRDEMKNHFGEDKRPTLLWHKKDGVSIESAVNKLKNGEVSLPEGIDMKTAEGKAQAFFAIHDGYLAAKSKLDSFSEELPKALGEEELEKLKKTIARKVLDAYESKGGATQIARLAQKLEKDAEFWKERISIERERAKTENRVLDKLQRFKDIKTGKYLNSATNARYKTDLFKRSILRLSALRYRGNLNASGSRKILAGFAEWYTKENPMLKDSYDENIAAFLDALVNSVKPFSEEQQKLIHELEEKSDKHDYAELAEWYTKENPALKDSFDENTASFLKALAKNAKPFSEAQEKLLTELEEKSGKQGYAAIAEWYTEKNLGKEYDAKTKAFIKELADPKWFTKEELVMLENVIDHFKHLIETENKVWHNGKLVEAAPLAQKYADAMKANNTKPAGWLRKIFEKYTTAFADPMTVARYMDRYSSGFYTDMMGELRSCLVSAAIEEANARKPIEDFYEENKDFHENVKSHRIIYQGYNIPASKAMLLYMTLNREQALPGLARSGFAYTDGKEGNDVRVPGFADEKASLADIRVNAKSIQSMLYSNFTDAERKYIAIAEKVFNDVCKEMKRKADMLRMGYSNAIDSYYVPICRYAIAHSIDRNNIKVEMDSVSNASFNRDTVAGAKNELYIEDLSAVLGRHIHGVSIYSNVGIVADKYDALFNLELGNDPNKPTTLRTISTDFWKDGDNYFTDIIKNVKGIPSATGVGIKFLSDVRSKYAVFQLGANPKVWLTQLSSFAAATSIIDTQDIINGFNIRSDDVDEYCGLAMVRNSENTAALAQGVLEKVTGAIGDISMKPIGKVDRWVVKRLFAACQVHVSKHGGLKLNTEENKREAGKLLETIILETQQNSFATERSAAMRSGSEIVKSITMFSADSMKVSGRIIDAVGEYSVLKSRKKTLEESIEKIPDKDAKEEKRNELKKIEEDIKRAEKKVKKSVSALVGSAVFMALIAQLMRSLYRKDDDKEPEEIAQNMTVDIVGNLMGGLPILKDIYAFFSSGYDLDNYAYSTFNDILGSAADVYEAAGKVFSGELEGRDIAASLKTLAYASGQILGIPTRNIYNNLYGIINRISPSAGYRMSDTVDYGKNYKADLARAIEKGDDALAATIAGIMIDEDINFGATERKELKRLIISGFDVLPPSASETFTYDGEEYSLTPKELHRFEDIYYTANDAIADLIRLADYKASSDEVRCRAIRYIYNVYRNLAIQDYLGVSIENKNILFSEAIDVEKLALIASAVKLMSSDKDANGNAIAGTRKRKIQKYVSSLGLTAAQKYMVMGYLGYANVNGEEQVRRYVNRLNMSKQNKELLIRYSGY